MGIKEFIKKFFTEDQLLRFSVEKKRIRLFPQLYSVKRHQKEVLKNLIRESKKRKIHVGMYVVYDSSFGGYGLFEELKKSSEFDVKIVIIPDTSRGNSNLIESYQKTKDFFIKKYGSEFVEDGYKDGEFLDKSNFFDIIYFANPYDTMVHKLHGIEYVSQKNVLPIYITYGFMVDQYSMQYIIGLKTLALCWKIFSETRYTTKDYFNYGLYRNWNVVESGYPKLDSLSAAKRIECSRKRILICPHHSVDNSIFPLSTFLKFQDFYLELPDLFPDVDFIFRPHPLLFTTMVNKGFWSTEDRDAYLETLKRKNIIYSQGGDYYDVFVNSDAIIHDCSSFMVEYLYTGKPACFILNGNKAYKLFNKLGKACLSFYTVAEEKSDLINFIKRVQSSDVSEYSDRQKKFLKENIMLNYPKASKFVFDYLTESIVKKG